MLIRFLYNSLIFVIGFLLRLDIIKKLRKFSQQQKLFSNAINTYKAKENSFWFVVSSAGEFEQALPLIKILKQEKKDANIVVSFFSNSGFEMYAQHHLVDFSFYFPLDTKRNAQLMTDKLHAKAVFFIRYEIWLHLLIALKQNQIPTFLINKEDKNRTFIYQQYLNYSYYFFTEIFSAHDFGDTKIEQAIAHHTDDFENQVLDVFCKDSLVILLASCYLQEVTLVHQWYSSLKIKENIKIIICPHDPNEAFYETCNMLFEEQISKYSDVNKVWQNLLYIDKKGILKYLYRFVTISFVGGGFNNRLHNIYEALIYETIVCCGNNIDDFASEQNLAKQKIIFLIGNKEDWNRLIENITQVKLPELTNKRTKIFAQHQNTSIRIYRSM